MSVVSAADVAARRRGARHTLEPISSHYDVLGVDPDASPQEIRIAYRDRARRYHPDRTRGAELPDVEMSRINEAYRVLGDPGRRAVYDRSLAGTGPTIEDDADEADDLPPGMDLADMRSRDSVLSPSGPARVPWKLMAVTAIVGSAAVLIGATFNDPPSEEVPDGIIRVGSCIAVEANGDAREVACTQTDEDLVVELLIPTEAECPHPLVPHRDRLGLGIACTEDR
jgi:hypothetical protein